MKSFKYNILIFNQSDENNPLLTKFKIPTDEILPWPMTFPTEENQSQSNGKSSSESQNLPGTSGLCRDVPTVLPSQTVSGPVKNPNHIHYPGYNAYGNQYNAYQNGWYYNNRSYNQGYKMHRGWPYHNRAKGPEAVRTIYLFTYTTEHSRALLSKFRV